MSYLKIGWNDIQLNFNLLNTLKAENHAARGDCAVWM
jgi:hypothetical protein